MNLIIIITNSALYHNLSDDLKSVHVSDTKEAINKYMSFIKFPCNNNHTSNNDVYISNDEVPKIFSTT